MITQAPQIRQKCVHEPDQSITDKTSFHKIRNLIHVPSIHNIAFLGCDMSVQITKQPDRMHKVSDHQNILSMYGCMASHIWCIRGTLTSGSVVEWLRQGDLAIMNLGGTGDRGFTPQSGHYSRYLRVFMRSSNATVSPFQIGI